MRFYKISEEYIKYLKQFDERVYDNKNETRPYAGVVVLGLGEHDYFIPFSSPKEKHKKMKNTIDFHKIDNGNFGVLNLNGMIPVYKENLVPFRFEDENRPEYRRMLNYQFLAVKKEQSIILNKAEKLYDLYEMDESRLNTYQKKVKDRCLKFDKLEEAADTLHDIENKPNRQEQEKEKNQYRNDYKNDLNLDR